MGKNRISSHVRKRRLAAELRYAFNLEWIRWRYLYNADNRWKGIRLPWRSPWSIHRWKGRRFFKYNSRWRTESENQPLVSSVQTSPQRWGLVYGRNWYGFLEFCLVDWLRWKEFCPEYLERRKLCTEWRRTFRYLRCWRYSSAQRHWYRNRSRPGSCRKNYSKNS